MILHHSELDWARSKQTRALTSLTRCSVQQDRFDKTLSDMKSTIKHLQCLSGHEDYSYLNMLRNTPTQFHLILFFHQYQSPFKITMQSSNYMFSTSMVSIVVFVKGLQVVIVVVVHQTISKCHPNHSRETAFCDASNHFLLCNDVPLRSFLRQIVCLVKRLKFELLQ